MPGRCQGGSAPWQRARPSAGTASEPRIHGLRGPCGECHGLLERVRDIAQRGHLLTAELLAHLGEVDARRLYAEAGFPSMFSWCLARLGMCEATASRSIQVARAARRFPVVLEYLASGRVHLSGRALLASHLEEGSHRELLEAASGCTKRRIERSVADLAPRPGVPDRIRKLPERRGGAGAGQGRPGGPEARTPRQGHVLSAVRGVGIGDLGGAWKGGGRLGGGGGRSLRAGSPHSQGKALQRAVAAPVVAGGLLAREGHELRLGRLVHPEHEAVRQRHLVPGLAGVSPG